MCALHKDVKVANKKEASMATRALVSLLLLLVVASGFVSEVKAFAIVSTSQRIAHVPPIQSAFNKKCTIKQSKVTLAQSQEDSDIGSKLSTPLSEPALAALDIVALVGFAAVGKASHAPDGSVDLSAVLVTGFPFVVSWLLTSPLTGVYQDLQLTKSSASTGDIAKDALVQTAKGWALAVPLGCALRGIIKGYVPPVPFVIVTLIATLVILGGVRVVYALATTPEE